MTEGISMSGKKGIKHFSEQIINDVLLSTRIVRNPWKAILETHIKD